METKAIVEAQYKELRETVEASASAIPVLSQMAELVVATLEKGGKILTAGNGGSATDAMHMTEELLGRYKGNRRSLPSICLAADASTLTCIGNDFGYEQIFARQLEALGTEDDLLILFTTSGKSGNLITAIEEAKKKKISTIVFLGRDGGALRGKADLEWIVPHQQTARIQEMHTWAMHVMLEVVENQF